MTLEPGGKSAPLLRSQQIPMQNDMKASPRAATFASIFTSSKRSCLMACAADGMSLDIFFGLNGRGMMAQWVISCTINVIKWACVVRFMARNR